MAFSGNVLNADGLIAEMKARGKSFFHGYNIEVISKIIMEEKDVVNGIQALAKKIRGAYSLVVLTKDGIYAARDITSLEQLRDLEDWIAEDIGADSVKHNSLDAFVTAIRVPKEDLCLMCFDGKSPTGGIQ